MIKRSELLKEIDDVIVKQGDASVVLSLVENYLEPIVRPLTDAEVEEHVLVKQVHDSRKDEVRNYVRNLEYEWKREYLPEDKK
jgi:hypothetical protein